MRVRVPFRVGFLGAILLVGCDSLRHDNPMDAAGSDYHPPLVRARANPGGSVRPSLERIAAKSVLLTAYDTTGYRFSFWSGAGIDGDTSRQILAPLTRDTNDFVAWFVPVWGDQILLDDFNSTYPRCGGGTRWCSTLSIAEYARTRGATPFRGWYAFRDSLPGTTSRVEPVESLGWDSALGEGSFGQRGMDLTLTRDSGGYSGVGLELGSPSRDLTGAYSIVFWSRAQGKLTITFQVAGYSDGGLQADVVLADTAWSWHQVWTRDLAPAAGTELARSGKGSWDSSCAKIRSVEFSAGGGGNRKTSSLALRIKNPTILGVGLGGLAP